MRTFNSDFDRKQKRMNRVFWSIFAAAAVFIFAIWSVIGYVVYQVASDPEGTANFVGNIAAEAIRPVVDVIKE